MKNYMYIIFPITFFTLAILHSALPKLTIDSITIALIILGFFPWLPLLIKELSLPGGVKITFSDLKKPTDNIIEVGKIEKMESILSPDQILFRNQLENIAQDNPNLALVAIRIEIEKRIRELASTSIQIESHISLRRTIDELTKMQILTPSVTGSLLELISFGNKAAHGEDVSNDVIYWAIDYGPQILSILDQYVNKYI